MSDPRLAVGPTLIDRLLDMGRRLTALEARQGNGILGTDQTILGGHDRLDTVLGIDVAAPTDAPATGDFLKAVVTAGLLEATWEVPRTFASVQATEPSPTWGGQIWVDTA